MLDGIACDGCNGFENLAAAEVEAITGALDGVKVVNEDIALSGVIAREPALSSRIAVCIACADDLFGDAEDHEKLGMPAVVRCGAIRNDDGRMAGPRWSQLSSIKSTVSPVLRPDTSVSKSLSSVCPLLDEPPLTWLFPTKVLVDVPFADSSCNFRVCSRSILADSDFIKIMNDWNCSRFNSGPRLNCHSRGRMSIAQ